MNKALQWAIARILDITGGSDYYGSVTLRFEAGNLIRIESQRSEKPPTTAS